MCRVEWLLGETACFSCLILQLRKVIQKVDMTCSKSHRGLVAEMESLGSDFDFFLFTSVSQSVICITLHAKLFSSACRVVLSMHR